MAAEMCATCGLPAELCVCEDVSKSDVTVRITTEERRFGKEVTLVKRLDETETDVSALASQLKHALGCGGTVQDDGAIMLQGNHTDRVTHRLQDDGYAVEQQ